MCLLGVAELCTEVESNRIGTQVLVELVIGIQAISLRIFCVELQFDVMLITSWFIVT